MAEQKKTQQTQMESLSAFIILSTVTFGLYLWYWGWHVWALERGLSGRKLNATLRGAFLGFTLFSLVKSLNKRLNRSAGKDLAYSSIYFAISVVGAAILSIYDHTLNLTTIILSSLIGGFLIAIVLLPVRQTVHDVWVKHEDEIPKLPRMARNVKLIVALYFFEVLTILGWLPLIFGSQQ